MARPIVPHRFAASGGRLSLALGLVFAPAAALAQQVTPTLDTARTLSIETVVQSTIDRGPDLAAARWRVEASRGALYSAGAPFDLQRHASVGAAQTQQPAALLTSGVGARSGSITYSVDAGRTLRSGLVLQPKVSVSRIDPGLSTAAVSGAATVAFDVRAPLLRGRGGGLTTATERAAECGLNASNLDLQQTAAASVFQAIAAYWQYVGAERQVEQYRRSEERAAKLVEETGALVRADQRPAADLVQLRGNLAARAAARIDAERAVVVARQQVALLMGAGPLDASRLPRTGSVLPEPDSAAGVGADGPALIRGALAQRADLSAARLRRAGTRALVTGATNELRPRLDVALEVGYTGFDGGAQLGQLFTPLYRNVPGLSTSITVSYDLPRRNAEARGQAMQQQASDEQAAIAEATLVRTITSDVVVAADGLTRSADAYRRSREAVQLYARAVESERLRFRLGQSTLFEVLQAEDALVSAQLAQVSVQVRYATSVAQLRYATGRLVAPADDRLVADLTGLAPPAR